MQYYNINKDLLQTFQSECSKRYEVRLTTSFSFKNQQNELDYSNISAFTKFTTFNKAENCHLYLIYYPNKYVISLNNLKYYLQQYKTLQITKEAVLDNIFNNINDRFEPNKLTTIIKFKNSSLILNMNTEDSFTQEGLNWVY